MVAGLRDEGGRVQSRVCSEAEALDAGTAPSRPRTLWRPSTRRADAAQGSGTDRALVGTGRHIPNIIAKLHVADRAQAIVKAREAGLGRQVGDQ